MAILLAPMEGLLDCVLRDVLTRVGGVDLCVSEFIRVTGTLLPERAFAAWCPSSGRAGAPPPGAGAGAADGFGPGLPGRERGAPGGPGAGRHRRISVVRPRW
jgi:hypothetical protein